MKLKEQFGANSQSAQGRCFDWTLSSLNDQRSLLWLLPPLPLGVSGWLLSAVFSLTLMVRRGMEKWVRHHLHLTAPGIWKVYVPLLDGKSLCTMAPLSPPPGEI